MGDGSYLNIDLVNEFSYNTGTFRRLDDQNLVLTFDDNDEEEVELLVHLKSLIGSTATFQTVRYTDDDGDGENEQGEQRLVTTFTMTINDETVPTISQEQLMGKWSISAVVESEFSDGMLRNEDINDNIPNNKMTLGFREDNELLFIDLVSGPQIRLGEFEMLDASNLLIHLGGDGEDDGDGDDDEDEMEYEIFQLTSFTDGQAIMSSFERAEEDEDFDLFSFELTMTKNDGTEPSITAGELIGTWEVMEVENLSEDGGGDGGGDEGPQVGMQIGFDDQLGGLVSFDGQTIFDFDYEMIDLSNILLTFEEESDGGNEEETFNLFHVNSSTGDRMELMIYIIRGPNDDDGGDNDDGDANMELEFRIIVEKQDG